MSALDLSICIVTRQACRLLRDCLHSIQQHPPRGTYEIIVVDNASSDGTVEMLQSEFPQVQVIRNSTDKGYTAPMNQALRVGQGRYLMQLNPDTLALPGAFDALLSYADAHPQVGILGPKVLNPNGTLQKPCRRGESRPLAVFSYFLGLSRLFPRSKLFGGYLLNYLDEDQTTEVAGVSGSCMLIRREVVDRIGYLDERFFAYQEDADYCFHAKKAGWSVVYYPQARIIHYGGQGGSKVRPYHSIYQWHRSYFLHYRKNMARDYPFLFNGFYYAVMGLKLALALVGNFLNQQRKRLGQKP